MAESERPLLLDTNLIVRYLTGDPPQQAALAKRLLEGPRPLLVSEVILAECVFVLTSVYRMPREAVVDALCDLLQRRNLEPLALSKRLAIEALGLCRDSKRVSFADALLWARARQSGLPVATFDRSFPNAGIEVDRPR